jgi:ribosomal protein S18 acetylase RimI-like enzyme
MLRDFNEEFDEPSPAADVVAPRIARMMSANDAAYLLAGDGPDGFCELRFHRTIYSDERYAHLGELYVVPAMRGQGLGRALLEAAMDLARKRGADHIDLNTSETDTAARALYQSSGFTNREGGPDGPVMLFYERDI